MQYTVYFAVFFIQNHRLNMELDLQSLFGLHVHTLQQESHLCIPRKGIARPQSQFLHVSVNDLYIPRIVPHIFLQQNKQTDRGNI